MSEKYLNLRLFDGESGGEGGSGDAAAAGAAEQPAAAPETGRSGRNPLANVRYGRQTDDPAPEQGRESETIVTTDTAEERRAEFERLIKGEYKDLYDERAQKMIDARFKQTKQLEAQVEQARALAPIMDLLASKYGVDSSDAAGLLKAIQADDSYYEDEAMEKGLTVEQLKHMKQIERENAEFRKTVEEQQRKQNADVILSRWMQQAEACKQMYPQFDLDAEFGNPNTGQRFAGLLQNGIDVQTAFEVIHKDELIGGAMQYTAQTIREKTVNDIRARGMRPAENGTSGNNSAVITKTDPKTFTKKDRDEISRRVMRGERIVL